MPLRPLHERDEPRAWIRERAHSLGLTQRALAAAAGVSPSQLSNFFAQKRELADRALDALAEALGLSPEDRGLLGDLLELRLATGARRAALALRIAARRGQVSSSPLPADQADLLGGPATLVLRELLSCAGCPADPAGLGARLSPPLSPGEARAALDRLRLLGLAAAGPGHRPRPTGDVNLSLYTRRPTLVSWSEQVQAWGLASLAQRDGQQRHVELLVQGVPARLAPTVAAELDGLTWRVSHLITSALNQGATADRVQILLLRRWPLTGPLDQGDETPAPEGCGPPPLEDYRTRLAEWANETDRAGNKRRTLGMIQRRLRAHLPEGEAIARSTVFAILSGKRHVSLNHVGAWASVMGLDADQRAWLALCVERAHTRSEPRGAELERERAALERVGTAHPLEGEAAAMVQEWVVLALAELAMSPAARADAAWIAGAFSPPIHVATATAARDLLLRLGVLETTPGGGLTRRGALTLATRRASLGAPRPAPAPSPAQTAEARRVVATLAEALLAQGRDHLMDTGAARRGDTGLLIQATPDALLPEIGHEIRASLARVQGLADDAMASGEPPERVLALSVMLFAASGDAG